MSHHFSWQDHLKLSDADARELRSFLITYGIAMWLGGVLIAIGAISFFALATGVCSR